MCGCVEVLCWLLNPCDVATAASVCSGELWKTGISLLWRTVALVSFYNACVRERMQFSWAFSVGSSPFLSSLTAHFLWLCVHLIIFNWIHLSGDTEVEPVSWQLWESHIAGWDTKAFCQEAACICANTGLEDSRTEIEPQALQGIGSYSLP